MNQNAETVERVERERERESCNLENETSMVHYALLNIHARDGWATSCFLLCKKFLGGKVIWEKNKESR